MQFKAAFHCTGPVHLFAGFYPHGDPRYSQYLGTCESCPKSNTTFAWRPIFTSIGGRDAPTDKQTAGCREFIILDLNRFCEKTLDNILTTPGLENRFTSKVPGTTKRLGRGQFLVADNAGFQLWLIFSFYGTQNATAYPDLPPGLWFPFCSVTSAFVDRQGTQNRRVQLLIEAQEGRDKKTGDWILSSTDIARFGNLHQQLIG
jgi:hypothetical protein